MLQANVHVQITATSTRSWSMTDIRPSYAIIALRGRARVPLGVKTRHETRLKGAPLRLQ